MTLPAPTGVIRGRAFADPIRGRAVDFEVPAGLTVAEIVGRVPMTPGLAARRDLLVVRIDGREVDRTEWETRAVVPAADGSPVRIAVGLPLRGKGGGRKILMVLAAIALAVATAGIAAGGLASTLGTAFAAGSWGATALSAGVAVAGSLLLQGLAPKPKTDGGDGDRLGQAGAGGGFRPGGSLQRVIGRTIVEPRQILPPWTEITSGVKMENGKYRYSQFVNVMMALAGEVDVEEIRVDGVDAADMLDVETEVLTHSRGGPKLAKVKTTAIEQQVGVELSNWAVDPDEDADEWQTLAGTAAESSPIWHRVETRDGPSRFRVELVATRGLSYTAGSGVPYSVGVSLRIRGRRRAESGWGAWFNLPELVIRGFELHSQVRLHLEIHWVTKAPATAGNAWPPKAKSLSGVKGWARAFVHPAWPSSLLTPNVAGGFAEWEWSQQILKVYLPASIYPKGRYQFEVKRSWPFRDNRYNAETDSISESGVDGPIQDFHVPPPATDGSANKIVWTPRRAQDAIAITSVQSVFPEYPVATSTDRELTLIWVRARDRQIQRISVVATGKVRHWTGSAWTDERVASTNPADHYRDVLQGPHNALAVGDGRVDLAALQDWATWCEAAGHQVGFVAADGSVDEALAEIALAGRASPGRGPTETIVIDRARPEIVGIISSRNSSAHLVEMPFTDVPHALRCTFADEADDWSQRTVIVYAPGYGARAAAGVKAATRFEAVTYRSIPTEAKVRERALADLHWLLERARLRSCTVPVEYLDYARGDRVLFESDIVGRRGGAGRIDEVLVGTGGLVEGLVLDVPVDYGTATTTSDDLSLAGDLSTLDDLSVAGDLPIGLAIRRADGAVTTMRAKRSLPASAAGWPSDRVVAFATPIAMPTAGGEDLVGEGMLVVTGQISTIARDCLVWAIDPGPDLTATITLVDYAGNTFYGDA